MYKIIMKKEKGGDIDVEELEWIRAEVRKFKHDTGCSNEEIAGKIGIGRSSVYRFLDEESGRMPGLKMIVKFRNFIEGSVKNKRGRYTEKWVDPDENL